MIGPRCRRVLDGISVRRRKLILDELILDELIRSELVCCSAVFDARDCAILTRASADGNDDWENGETP